MFCHKCGTQIAEGAAFCHKCGTKVVYADTFQQPIDATVQTIESQIEMAQEISAVPVQADTAVNGENDFRRFLDSHVQATTAYLSAEELLNSHVPQRFVWVCFVTCLQPSPISAPTIQQVSPLLLFSDTLGPSDKLGDTCILIFLTKKIWEQC